MSVSTKDQFDLNDDGSSLSTSAMKMFSQMLTQFFGSETVNDSPSRRRILPGVVIVVALAGLSITIVISADQSPRFYEAVDADIAVFSTGAENTYGHPRQETLDLVEKFGAVSARTDIHGMILI